MNLLLSLYLAALFAAFVPGVLVTLPRGGKKMTVLAVHALLFVVVWHFTRKIVSRATEGFQMNITNVPGCSSSRTTNTYCKGGMALYYDRNGNKLPTPPVYRMSTPVTAADRLAGVKGMAIGEPCDCSKPVNRCSSFCICPGDSSALTANNGPPVATTVNGYCDVMGTNAKGAPTSYSKSRGTAPPGATKLG